jgi:hypothetical protein
MKKALPLLILCLVAAFASAATPVASNQYQHINYTWLAPNSTYPACSTTVTSSCLNNYTLTQAAPGGTSNIILTVANGGVAAGGSVAYSYGPGGYLYCGTWGANVVANYLDSSGATVSSNAVATTVAVPCPLVASPATSLAGTPAP